MAGYRLGWSFANSKLWSPVVELQWKKGAADDWCVLDKIDLNSLEQSGFPHGVFVIWRSGIPRRMSVVLYVGRGFLRRGLADCRRDPLFRGEPGLRVTWASVEAREVDSVAAYLYQQLQPVWGDMVPAATQPLPVNLPPTA
jgi:hypothetical protein